jgi:hypothetical protein
MIIELVRACDVQPCSNCGPISTDEQPCGGHASALGEELHSGQDVSAHLRRQLPDTLAVDPHLQVSSPPRSPAAPSAGRRRRAAGGARFSGYSQLAVVAC